MRQGTGGLFRLIPSSPPPGAGISEKSVRRAHTPRGVPGGYEEFSPPSQSEGGNKSPEPFRKSQICAPPVFGTGGAQICDLRKGSAVPLVPRQGAGELGCDN